MQADAKNFLGKQRRQVLASASALVLPRCWGSGLGSIVLLPIANQAQGQTVPRGSDDGHVSADRALRFPRDFGAHPTTRVEWWYVTGYLSAPGAALDAQPSFGFQITFFRSRTDLGREHPSAFAAQQLVFAHVAVTDVTKQTLRHDDRISRTGFGIAQSSTDDTRLKLRDWTLDRQPTGNTTDRSVYRTQIDSRKAGFGLHLQLSSSQAVLLQGQAGFSRKGPQIAQASHYYSQPHLVVDGELTVDGRRQRLQGRAWLDHEWSNSLLDPQAVGWDWIGMNLLDGGALTAFRLRRADGSTLYAGGGLRTSNGVQRNFAADEVQFRPQRRWTSPQSNTSYPVEWEVITPSGDYKVRGLVDAQELDSRASTGTIYWEGLSELLDSQNRRLGWGYLEMTGYATRLKL